MVDGMGAPSFVPRLLRLMPGAWRQLTAVAHTLPYDIQLVDGYQAGRPLPASQWAAVTIPVLVMCGAGKESPAWFRHAATAVAGALPDGQLTVRHGLGHTKKLDAKTIASTLTEFLTGVHHA
jgi:hypothetical protein